MKKLITTILFLLLIPNITFGAIAFDAYSFDNNADTMATSHTTAHTVTGSDTILIVGVRYPTLAQITSVTYAGVSMTYLASQATGVSPIHLYYLTGASTGNNNLVVTLNTSNYCYSSIASYTGVNSTGQPDAYGSGSDSSHPLNPSLTIITDNSWMMVYGYNTSAAFSAVAGTTLRSSGGYGATGFCDSGAAVSSGSNTESMDYPGGTSYYITMSFAPVGGAPPAASSYVDYGGVIFE